MPSEPVNFCTNRNASKRFRARQGILAFACVITFLTCLGWPSNDAIANPFAIQQKLQPSQSVHGLNSQFLILRTGSVYEGQLEFSGDKYIVRRPTGATIKFSAGEVDFFADTLEDAYLKLALRIASDDLLGQQRLANWTLKNRLPVQARQQIDVLQLLAPNSAMTRLAERQLAALLNPAQATTTNSESTKPASTIRELPKAQGELATNEELNRTIDSFNEANLRAFNRTIHPKIVNGCAAARCHGGQDSPMRLWRVENRGGTNSTGVRRNLHAISQFLDRNNPADSKLLSYAKTVHGGMKAPAYDENSFHYYAIRDWILSTGTAGKMNGGTISDVSQTSYVNNPEATPDKPMQNTPVSEDDSKDWPTLPGFESDHPSPVDLNQQKEKFVPRDEFDPEIFNRRFVSELSATRRPSRPSQKAANSVNNKLPISNSKPPTRQQPEQAAAALNQAKPRRIKSLPPVDNRDQ